MQTAGDHRCFLWSAKQITMAALLGTIAVTAAATVIIVVLRPSPISFSIANARAVQVGRGATWKFDLVATNPSRRAGVDFLMISAAMEYRGANGLSWNLQVGTPAAHYQPPRSWYVFPLNVSLSEQDYSVSDVGVVNTSVPMSALVIAKMQFKVGPCYTMPYEMTVICKHIRFVDNRTAAGHGREPASISCTRWLAQ